MLKMTFWAYRPVVANRTVSIIDKLSPPSVAVGGVVIFGGYYLREAAPPLSIVLVCLGFLSIYKSVSRGKDFEALGRGPI